MYKKLTAMLLFGLFSAVCAMGSDLRLGIIGTDTSHVSAFAQLLNDDAARDHVPGARVVAAYQGGSKDLVRWRTQRDRVGVLAAPRLSSEGG